MIGKSILILFIALLAVPVSADFTYFDRAEPYNDTGFNSSTPDFNMRIILNDSSTSADCELFIDDVGYGSNSSVQNDSLTTLTANSSLSDGRYYWKINCTTNDSINQETGERLIHIDTIAPNVTLVSPSPQDQAQININNANPSFTVNASFNDSGEILECVSISKNLSNQMTVYDGYCTGEVTYFDEGEQDYFVIVTDKANIAQSESRTITIDIITFAEQNPLYLVIPSLLWAVLAIFIFLLWENWSKLDKNIIMHVGVAMMIAVSFIIALTVTIGLVT